MPKSTLNYLGLVAAITACTAAGCVQTPTTVRGQNPAAPAAQAAPMLEGPIIGTAPGYGERPLLKHSQRDFKMLSSVHNPAYADGNGFYDSTDIPQQRVYEVGGDGQGQGCPACNGGLDCPDGGCPHCGCGCDHGCPDHYHTYSYKWPKNLVYPQPVLPAGMVQYPYYTLKGPSDFFMK